MKRLTNIFWYLVDLKSKTANYFKIKFNFTVHLEKCLIQETEF